MGRQLGGALATGAIACALILTVSPQTARGCEICRHRHQYLVVRGRSPDGLPWRVTTGGPSTDSLGRRGVEFHFDYGPPASFGVGFGSGMALPVPDEFAAHGVMGTDLSPYPESDIAGITGRGIAALIVKMSEGPSLEIRPLRARAELRRRFPWIRRLGFFDVFFAEGLQPVLVRALDPRERTVARAAAQSGYFWALRPRPRG